MTDKDKSVAESTADVAGLLEKALDVGTPFGTRVIGYVKKGGDITLQEIAVARKNLNPHLLEGFLEQFPQFSDYDKAPSIFNHPDHPVHPFYRFHEDTSIVCFLVASANVIYYSMCRVSFSDRDQTIPDYALNVSRFMRNRFTDEEIFENIFRGEGGYPELMLRRLLEPFNPGKMVVRRIDLWDGAELAHAIIHQHLEKHSALIIEKFQVFPEFVDSPNLSFDGDFNDKPKYPPSLNVNHALLIVGVWRTGNPSVMGGLAVMVQNTWWKKPFAVIGYDLLRSMKVDTLLAVEKNLHYETRPYTLSGNVHMTQSGIPPGDSMPLQMMTMTKSQKIIVGVHSRTRSQKATRRPRRSPCPVNGCPLTMKRFTWWVVVVVVCRYNMSYSNLK